MKTSKIAEYLIIYGLTHLLVDASCMLLIVGGINHQDKLLEFLLLYNVLAFGLQLPFGIILDKFQKPGYCSALGCLLSALSLIMFRTPYTAIILASVGNALFHVGGGVISLNLDYGKAALPGVFVAPGAIGLLIGSLIPKYYGYRPGVFIGLLVICGVIIYIVKNPSLYFERKNTGTSNYLFLIVFLLLITICIRSVIGLSISFPWKSKIHLAILLAFCISFGKGFGGFLSNYIGWIKVSVGGLIISAILLHFGIQFPVAGMAGMFLFNITMPVTLVAISNLFPGRPGFSFGLTTLALVIGALPAFFNSQKFFSDKLVLESSVIISAALLYIGLLNYSKHIRKISGKV